jgi:hypothetical protein
MSTTNSNHGDNESIMGLTTPSSTQPSSPSASPALSATDDRKRNKSESEDSQSNRNRYFIHHLSSPKTIFCLTRSNSGANGSSTTSTSYVSSPRNPFSYQQSPGVSSSSSTKTPLSSSSGLSASVPPHFTYPTSTQPVLQYSTIVSQNTLPSTSTSNSNSISKQQSILSPKTNQMSRQTSVNNNDSTVITTSTQPTSTIASNSTASSSHPPSLLANNDRTGRQFYSSRGAFFTINLNYLNRLLLKK